MPACVQTPDQSPLLRTDGTDFLMTRADQQHRPPARTSAIKARVTSNDARLIEQAAARHGLPVATFVRAAVLDAALCEGRLPQAAPLPSLPSHPLPVLDNAARIRLADLRAAIGRTGGLANSLVRLAHRGQIREASLGVAVQDLADLCRQLVNLLGGTTR